MRVEYYYDSIRKTLNRKWYSVIIIGVLLSFQYIIISVDADPSQVRWGHASALINNRLYVYGGRLGKSKEADTTNTNELLSLDISKPFDPNSPPWEVKSSLLPSGDSSPFLVFHSCSMGGNQNELLILFGGESRDQRTSDNSLFEYNTTTETWLNLPVTTANTPSRRIDHTIASISNSIAYLWGGTSVAGDGANVNAINELYKLTTGDTISWELSETQSPAGRWGHSATLLNGKIYIIGGVSDGNSLALMTDILVFDTDQQTWTSQTATGDTVPAQRRGHRAVGTADNRIIIYGGATANLDASFDDIAVLNVVGDVLTWEIHTVTGNKPPGRFDHSMTLVGSKAIITYGFEDAFNPDDRTGTKLFVFDTDSYTWEQTYDPSSTISVTHDPTATERSGMSGLKSSSNNRNLGVIVGVPIAGGVLILVLAGLFFWIRKRKNRASFTATPYEKQQASVPPIAGPVPLYNLSSLGPSQGGAGGTTNNAPFIPPFATSSYQRRQPSFGSLSETRNLTPVDQHDSWGSAPSNNSQSQLPQINPNIPYYETGSYYKPNSPRPTSSRPTSPLANPNIHYLPPQTPPPQHHHSSISPTPPPFTSTPPPISPQKDVFSSSAAAITSSSTKSSSINLRLDSDSNTAPVEFDFNLPPVAPLSINRSRTPSPSQPLQIQTQEQQQLTAPQIPISTTSSSSSLLQDLSNVLASPIEIEPTETATISTDEGGAGGSFNSPLFRTEALSSFAGTAASASPADRSLSLRSAPRLNTSITPRNSTNMSSPSPISTGSRLRSGTFERAFESNITGSSRPTSPTDNNNTSDDSGPRGRLFVANPDPTNDSD